MASYDLPAQLLGHGHPDSPKTNMSTRASLTNIRSSESHRASRDAVRRNTSYGGRRGTLGAGQPVTDNDAYTYALRAAYLAYLLQPRQKRVQHVANTSKPIQRASTSINDMVKDFSLIRDSKSTRFPHGFMAALDKRITGVLIGSEKGQEYGDPLVKRTFANFLNEFKNPTFRKTMEKDRRVEDLLLIFYSRATGELQKGKSADDDAWKWMVDRHVALFVRLISGTLGSNDWTRDRPELSQRLKTLETKLLQHDQDLADTSQRGRGSGGQSIEVEIPRSYEVRDMPLVIRVCSIFAKPTAQAQSDILAHKDQWTERAALKDLKDYQNHMMLNTRVTLSKDDFDLDEAFETWRKGEFSDLSQLMLTIVQQNPELARASSSGAGSLPASAFKPFTVGQSDAGAEFPDSMGFSADQSLDMSGLDLDDSPRDSGTASLSDATRPNFTFIPPDARAHYRRVLKVALTHDLADPDLASTTEEAPAGQLLSRQSTELLNELAARWRIPQFSRMVLFLDVMREKYCLDRDCSLDTVDAAFLFVKEAPLAPEPTKKAGSRASLPATQAYAGGALSESERWTLADFASYRSTLATLHDALLRELYDLFQHCYEAKPPSIGSVMYVLDTHIVADPLFPGADNDTRVFSAALAEALKVKARAKYHELLSKHISDTASEWEFFHVMALGKAVTGLCEKIQKRYRKSPEVLGVNPLTVLVEEVLPAFADDARELVQRIMDVSKEAGKEVPVEDGFELYRELVEIRRVHAQALPGREFGFHVEGLLQEFVWRWIALTDAKLVDWVDGAVAHDKFQLVADDKSAAAVEAGLRDEERHSQSVVDVFTIFNQGIERIVALEWDDDLQYAKFMTAVSKSVGKGVARYCELLEALFVKEMERQTPEQAMREAQQSQQQRWLTAAKDAWGGGNRGAFGVSAGGEKIEPFQFWPESFVKVNDIEFATQQLDLLEREINVDACAEVINRLEPPPPVRRGQGGQKFMFTIKILEAEDLKAGDVNGLSDPYVVLGDEYQKRLAKTRTVYQSLNPRWDETVDILTAGPLNVVATVWDWDLLGDHDCLGRTSLKLDPSHFNDFLPREYWLDLDTQGRVLVRVGMEGERDDIQFYFGKAFRCLRRAEREMVRRVTDQLSAYILQCLSRRTLRALLGQGQGALGGVTMSSARGYFSKLSSQVAGRPVSVAGGGAGVLSPGAAATTTQGGRTVMDASQALKPLLNYFDDNFAIMKQTLTSTGLITVMTRLWKHVLVTIESLLVPPLSDKPSAQRPLSQPEVDIVFKWLQTLFAFFNAFDEEEGEAQGVSAEVLKSGKYHDLQGLFFFYFERTEELVRTSDGIAQASAQRKREEVGKANARLSARGGGGGGGVGMGMGAGGLARHKSVLMSRSLGTLRQAKEAKRKEAQADPNDDMILRILRMRPEAERYLRDRSRQKERLAAAAAAEAIVRQSLMASSSGRAGGAGQLGGAGGGGGGGGGAGLSGPAARSGGLARRWDTVRE
ncbi:hypothetical protein LTR08_000561 [Meristemomyces frigidus]|nr:hypothetical protein LTR08_000561 [Meristemomyces frigidus]